jgi:hypothetical protein
MKKGLIFTLFLMLSLGSNAQVGLSGGFNAIKAFGVPGLYEGMHIGVEIPRDDAVSFYMRASGYLSSNNSTETIGYATAINPSTTPYYVQVPITTTDRFNYTVLEGGSRYYIGDGYDSGFGAYGGSNVSIIFNSVRKTESYGAYDASKYTAPALTEYPKGSIFNIGFGLTGGVKNTIAGIGTIYFDMNFSYLILGVPSNSTASATSSYSPLVFNFALGFRRELY